MWRECPSLARRIDGKLVVTKWNYLLWPLSSFCQSSVDRTSSVFRVRLSFASAEIDDRAYSQMSRLVIFIFNSLNQAHNSFQNFCFTSFGSCLCVLSNIFHVNFLDLSNQHLEINFEQMSLKSCAFLLEYKMFPVPDIYCCFESKAIKKARFDNIIWI